MAKAHTETTIPTWISFSAGFTSGISFVVLVHWLTVGFP